MPIEDLLSQVLAEHEALQVSYNEVLLEMNLLRKRFVDADEEAAPLQHQFSCEPLHSTLDSGALIESSGTNVSAEEAGSGAKTDPLDDVDDDSLFGRRISLESKASAASASSAASTLSAASASSAAGGRPTRRNNMSQPRLRPSLSVHTDEFLHIGSFLPESEHLTGNACQDNLLRFLNNKAVELFFVAVVVSNVVVLWIETDRRAARLPKAIWSRTVHVLYLVIYFVEFMIRVLAHRTHIFDDKWNRLDFGVIAIDILSTCTEALFSNFSAAFNASIFRIFRVFRLVRVLAVFRYVPEVQLLIHGFFGAMKAVFFTTILVFIVVLLWSFIFVEVVSPHVYELTRAGDFDDCLRCQRAYQSMFDAHMTILQQVVAGDAWGMVTLEVIFAHPETSVLFVACLMSIQFAVLNLIFTVIVDAAMRAREDDQMLKLGEKENSFQVAKSKLSNLCESLDLDGSGDLSLEELIVGYASNKEFADTMASLDVTSDDMGALFMLLDNDRSGTVSREEFVNNIYQMKERDLHTTMMFLKIHMEEVRVKMKEEVTSLLKSNLKRSHQTAKHMEKMTSHIEAMMQHLEMLPSPPEEGTRAKLRSPPEEECSKLLVTSL